MNESTKYTGPWIVGMLTADGDRIVRVDDGVVTGWQDMEATSWHVSSMVGEIMAPDWADGGSVGALAQAVRSLYADPGMTCRYSLFHDGTVKWSILMGTMQQPGFEGPTEHDAWLAAYHAHRDAAGTTANDIEVIRG